MKITCTGGTRLIPIYEISSRDFVNRIEDSIVEFPAAIQRLKIGDSIEADDKELMKLMGIDYNDYPILFTGMIHVESSKNHGLYKEFLGALNSYYLSHDTFL